MIFEPLIGTYKHFTSKSWLATCLQQMPKFKVILTAHLSSFVLEKINLCKISEIPATGSRASCSTNEVLDNLLILEVTELQNNTSVFCQGSKMSAIVSVLKISDLNGLV